MDDQASHSSTQNKPVMLDVYRFYKRDQLPNEPVKDYITELENLAEYCQFGEFLKRALRDRFVLGLSSESAQNRLFLEIDLTLDKAIELAVSLELTCIAAQDLYTESTEVNAVKDYSYKPEQLPGSIADTSEPNNSTAVHNFIKQEKDIDEYGIDSSLEGTTEDGATRLQLVPGPVIQNALITTENGQISRVEFHPSSAVGVKDVDAYDDKSLFPVFPEHKNENIVSDAGPIKDEDADTTVLSTIVSDDVTNSQGTDENADASAMRSDCNLCGKSFKTTFLKRHMLSHKTGKKQFNCDICNKTFTTNHWLRQHKYLHSAEKQFRCSFCDRTFYTEDNMKYHMLKHTRGEPYSCDICKKQFDRKLKLDIHIQKEHIKPNVPCQEDLFPCTSCNQTFVSSISFQEHTCKPGSSQSHRCYQCSRTFANSTELGQHLRNHPDERPFLCKECGRGFMRKQYLERHMHTHTGKKAIKCNICDKFLANRANLATHMRTHTNEKPYSCSLCHKSFAQKKTLNVHVLTHTGVKAFTCEICEKDFATRTHLLDHQRIHSDLRKYRCNICGKGFKWSGNLRAHKLDVHKLSIDELKQTNVFPNVVQSTGHSLSNVIADYKQNLPS